MPENVSVRAALNDATFVLSEAGIVSARQEARLLLEHVAGSSFWESQRLSSGQRDAFFAMVGQRATRQPLQHIMGVMYFRHLTLRARPGVFVVRPETEWVAEAAIAAARKWVAAGVSPRILDLGCGSGALGLSIGSEVPQSILTSIDVSAAAVALTRENAALCGVPAEVIQADVTEEPDLRQALSDCGRGRDFHLIVANPPYVVERVTQVEAMQDPALALYGGGSDGLKLPRKFLDTARSLIMPGGTIIMEHAETQGAALVQAALQLGAGYAKTGCDLGGCPRFLQASF